MIPTLLCLIACLTLAPAVRADEHWTGPVETVDRTMGRDLKAGLESRLRAPDRMAPVFEGVVRLKFPGYAVDENFVNASVDGIYALKVAADTGMAPAGPQPLPGLPTYLRLQLTLIGSDMLSTQGHVFNDEGLAIPGLQAAHDIEVFTPRLTLDRAVRRETRGRLDIVGLNTSLVQKVAPGEMGFIAGIVARALSPGFYHLEGRKTAGQIDIATFQAEVGVQLLPDVRNRQAYQLVVGGRTGIGHGGATSVDPRGAIRHKGWGGDLSYYAEARARFLQRIQAYVRVGADGRYGFADGADRIFEALAGAEIQLDE